MSANALEIQDILLDFCGIGSSLNRRRICEKQKFQDQGDKIFGRIKKLPVKSTLF